jgi:thioredoxin reductase
MKQFDIGIVGGGAAGLTAAMYAARRGLSVVILSRDMGGQTAATVEIENYPGIDYIEGPLLMERFRAQACRFGSVINFESVESIDHHDDNFLVKSDSHDYLVRAVILAFGKTPRKMNARGEDLFMGKGIYNSAPQSIEQYRGKRVGIIGGGNSAVQTAILLDDSASEVIVIHRRDSLTAEKILLDRFANLKRTRFMPWHTVTEVFGDDRISSCACEHVESKEVSIIPIEALFVHIGLELNTSFLPEWIERTPQGHIIVNQGGETTCPGIFAAGDVTTIPFQQIVISAGEGAKAALSAYHYLCQKDGRRVARADWGFIPTSKNAL